MAIGRISGPLLSKNLLRDGVDLAFETDLLYLDVTNGRIGVKKTNPAYELDVNGTINAKNLRVTYTGPGTGSAQIGKLTISSGTISTTVGPITIQPSGNDNINLVGNTTVTGNLHATGNITADGDITIGDNLNTDSIVFKAEVKSNIIPAEDNTYDLGSPTNAWATAYVDTLVANALTSQAGNISINPAGGLLDINGDINVRGRNPIGTAPVVTNVLYVTMDGNDTNDGRAQDPSRACKTISGAIRSPYYRPGTLIRVSSGHYYENNPILMQPNTAIIGDDLRTTSIESINKTQDLFHVQSGCYIAQMQFLNGRSGLLPGVYASGFNRGAYATAFPPQVNGAKLDVYQSPYIQNCTNQSGPWLIDGTLFVPNQTIQIPQAIGSANFEANTTTIVVTLTTGTIVPGMNINSGPQDPGFFNARTLMLANKEFIKDQVIAFIAQEYPTFEYSVAKCARDVGIIIENVAHDATFGGNEKSVEAGLAYYNGVINLIEGQQVQTTAAINYINTLSQYIIQNQTAPVISTATTQVKNTALTDGVVAIEEIQAGIDIITHIINSGTSVAPTIFVSAGPETPLVSAEILLQANRTFLQEEVTAYVDAQYPNFPYKKDYCYRDVGLIVDAVSQDILVGGNTKSIEAALSYYTGSKGDSSVAETAVAGNLELIKDIILNGPSVAPTPISGPNLGTNFSNAQDLLQKNRNFVQTEVSAYVRSLFDGTFRLTQAQQNLCFRDIGTILDSIAEDTGAGGNVFSVEAGLAYYNGVISVLPGNQPEKTALTLDYMTLVCRNIVKNIQNTGLYQTKISQVTTLPQASSTEYNAIATNVGLITDIITLGTSTVTTPYAPISLAMNTSTTAFNAFRILTENKDFLAAEVTGYIDDVYGGGFEYNPYKCFRDTGLIVDSLAFDLLYQGNTQAIFAGSQYYNQGGYTGQISRELTTTTNAIEYAKEMAKQIAINMAVPVIQSVSTQEFDLVNPGSEASTATVEQLFNTVTNILVNGTVGVTNNIVPNGTITSDSGIINAVTLIQANKKFIQDQVIAFADGDNTSFNYDRVKCSRDINLIVDALAQDLIFGGNSQSTFSGVQYWTQTGYVGEIPAELATTVSAIEYVRDLAIKVITKDVSGSRYQSAIDQWTTGTSATSAETTIIQNEFDLILDILNNGVDGVTDRIVPNSLEQLASSDIQNAYALLESNKAYIQAEAVAYVEFIKDPGFVYDQTKCERDVGYMVDSVAFDLLYSGNRQAIQSGVSYYNYNTVGTQVPNEQAQVTAAYNYINTLADYIITGKALPKQYQTTVSRVALGVIGTGAESVKVAENIGMITDIINFGPTVAPALTPISVIPSTVDSVNNAGRLLSANKAFINAEVIAYIDSIFVNGFNYDKVKCARDTGLIVKALAQDLLFNGTSQSTFSAIQYWNQAGYVGAIAGEVSTTTSAINYVRDLAIKVITKDTSGTRYQSVVQQSTTGTAATIAETQAIYDDFSLIVDIINNGTVGITDRIVPNRLTKSNNINVLNAYELLEANKEYLKTEAVAFVEASKTLGFIYDPTKCKRDVGFMVDSVAFDLVYGGNRQAIQSGVYYYGFSADDTQVPNELVQVTAAYNYIKSLSSYIMTGQRVPTQYQYNVSQTVSTDVGTSTQVSVVSANIDMITNIINAGPSVAETPSPIALTPVTDAATINAANLLEANIEFIKAEVIAYIDTTYISTQFNYDRIKCRRDVGYILDCISFDLLHGGNRQSIQAGVYYYGFNPSSSVLTYEITQATAAYNHIKTISRDIIQNITITPTVGNTSTQVILGDSATLVEAEYIANDINIITDIINTGDIESYPKTPISLSANTSTAVVAAYDLLLANREFIQNELIAYVDYNFKAPFVFDKIKCTRDTKLIVDSLALDILYDGNTQSTFAALQYWAQGASAIPNEETTTTNAINYARELAQNLLEATVSTATSIIVGEKFGIITDIISTGTSGITDMIVPNGLPSVNSTTILAYETLLANKSAIQDETVAHVNSDNPGFVYDQTKCRRDVGYIIDCVAFDLLHGGNRQSIQAGAYYFGFDSNSTNVPNEIPQTTAAYTYLKFLIGNVLQNTPVTRSYQVVYPQVIIPAYMGLATVIPGEQLITVDAITYLNSISQNIIANQPVPVKRSSATQTINTFFGGGEHAGAAILRNYTIISDIILNGPGVAPVAFTGSGFFATTGVSSDDVRQSPTVLEITTQTGNVYTLKISGPTVGAVYNGSLYFGKTDVFPKQDLEVETLSLEYTGNATTWNRRKVDRIGGMGGSLVDGSVVSDRSPIQSFVYDAYTQINQGGRGVHIINNGYAQLVSVFTVFCSVGVEVDNGGIASIVNSNSNFGDICLVAKGYGNREFSGTVYNPPYPTYLPNGEYYPYGYYPKNGFVEIYIPDTIDRPHISLVMEVEPPLDFKNDQGYPGFLNAAPNLSTLTTGTITINGIDTTGIAVGDSLYIRDQYNGQSYADTGTVITDVNYQSITINKALIGGGGDPLNANFFTLYTCGKAYYTVLSSTVNDSFGRTIGERVIPGATTGTTQVTMELAAIELIDTTINGLLTTALVDDPAKTFVSDKLNLITQIISANTLAEAELIVPPLSRIKKGTPPLGASLAIATIRANIETIVADTIAYIDLSFTDYNHKKCQRDIRLLLQQILYDLEFGGNYYSVYSGLSYWVRSGTHHIVNLEESVNNTALFPDGATVNFYQRSYISASGYVFEYVGAGTDYGALPQRGIKDPVQGKEVVQLNNGKVFFTSTDQNGDFRIGPGLVVSQATGVLSGRTFTKSLFANLTPFILAIEGGG